MKKTTFHDIEYEHYSWQDLGDLLFTLAKQLQEQDFDRIVALAKGGLSFARPLLDQLGLSELSSIQVKFYTGINTAKKSPVVIQSLPTGIENQKILVFDDVVDKGDTLKFATEYLSYHGPAKLTTACLIQKPWTTYEADYFVESSKSWIIFPYETRETIEQLVNNWQKAGDTTNLITEQLLEIGFSEAEVAMFASLE